MTNRKSLRGKHPGSYAVGNSNYSIRLIEYNCKGWEEKSCDQDDLKKLTPLSTPTTETDMAESKKRLILVTDFFDKGLLETIRDRFNVHALTLEDMVNLDQRSKHESFDNYEFCVMAKRDSNGATSVRSQISLLITQDAVIVFMTKPDADIELVVDRIKEGRGRIRQREHGYLGYALLDVMVDSYFIHLEDLESKMDVVDERIENEHSTTIAKELFDLKRQALESKKEIWPLREMVNSIIRNDNSMFFRDERNMLFFRDLQDHTFRLSDSTEALRETAYGLVEMQTNLVGMRMNEVMKVLTIITTVFTPVMFLASIYGMNFDSIPEIHIAHGYPIFWIVTVVLTLVQVYFYRRKGWI